MASDNYKFGVGVGLAGFLIWAFAIAVISNQAVTPPEAAQPADPTVPPNYIRTWHDEQRATTCYMIAGDQENSAPVGISCVPDWGKR
jgi:hypothetical protein